MRDERLEDPHQRRPRGFGCRRSGLGRELLSVLRKSVLSKGSVS